MRPGLSMHQRGCLNNLGEGEVYGDAQSSEAGPGTSRPSGQTGVARCFFGLSSFFLHLWVNPSATGYPKPSWARMEEGPAWYFRQTTHLLELLCRNRCRCYFNCKTKSISLPPRLEDPFLCFIPSHPEIATVFLGTGPLEEFPGGTLFFSFAILG